jgi:hypothetical protein
VRINKPGSGSLETEFAITQLVLAIISEALDQGILPAHDLLEIKPHLFRTNAPGLRMRGQVHYLGCVQQSFCGHAAPKNAEAPDFFASLQNHGPQTLSGSGASGRVSTAPATDHRKVEIKRSLP